MTSTKQLHIEYVSIDKLKPWEKNPRKISEEQKRALRADLERFGFVEPLVVDQHGIIVGGHQRVDVARDLGYKQVPIVRVKLTPRQRTVLNLALNKISGEWDNEKLAPLLEELGHLPELDMTGFSMQEANLIIEAYKNPEDDGKEDHIPRLDRNGPKISKHDVWALGEHRLMCGDATDEISWNMLMERSKAALVFTDPPYGVGYDVAGKTILDKVTGERIPHTTRGKLQNDQGTDVAIKALPFMFKHLIAEGQAYITCGTNLAVDLINQLRSEKIHYSTLLVWDKAFQVVGWNRYHAEHELILWCGRGSRPGKYARWFGPKQETTVWRIPLDAHGERLHPTQKPVKLYERAMVNSSARGEIVVDPFAGSGTLAIAAEKHKRRAFMMEIAPVFCQLIIKRWETWTGKKAECLS